MNIYVLIEDSQRLCYQADSMQAACNIAENIYIEEMKEASGGCLLTFDEDGERETFRRDILESCELVGELVNPK